MNKFFLSVLSVSLFFITAFAGGPSIWSVNSRADVLKGDAKGVSIDQNGTITLAPQFVEVFKTDQPYIWSSASDAAGNLYLGTGGDGKIFRFDSNGKGALFADLTELNVTGLAVGRSGEVFAATSPDGKVYKLDGSGKADVFFDPKEKYIWSLALFGDGSLAVGTGESGKIYRVRSANATPEASLFFDTSETHIISLISDKQGNLYAGTDPGGLVLKFSSDGTPFALLDSPLREMHRLAIGPDGSIYALALGESVSTPAPAPTAAAPVPSSKTVGAEKSGASAPEPPQKSRYDLSSAKSAVYRILPDGSSDVVWASPISAFSIYAQAGGVLVGTSDKGRIYSVANDGNETLLLQSDAGQVSTLFANGNSIYATSSNQGNLYRLSPQTVTEGSYESSVLDAKSTAAWGRIWWTGSGNVQLQTRSGNTETPNETWSAWSSPFTDPKGAPVPSPKAKYLQWRAVLRSSATPASVSEVNVSFLSKNIAPEVLQIQILPTNVGLAPNPPIQIDPNIELSGLDPSAFGIPNAAVPPRRVYQRGATSLQWLAEDRNGDKLVYDVFYRESGDASFKPLRENLNENFLTVDGQTLADGHYLFKVVAKDSPSNPATLALSGEKVSDPVDIDNTPPTVTAVGSPQITGNSGRIVFEAVDQASYITRAEFSVNGGDWQPVFADDGISDGPRERYTIDVPLKGSGEYAVTLRAFDANSNAGNARIIIRK